MAGARRRPRGGVGNGGSGRRPTRAAGRTCLVNRPERAHPGGQPYSFSACSHSRLYASCSARRARSFASRYSSTKRTFRRVEDVGTSAIAQRVDSAAQGVGPRTGRSPESTRKACAALGSKRSPRLRQPVGGARPPSSLGRRDLTHGRPGRILPPTATGASAPAAPQARRSCASDSTPGAGAGGSGPARRPRGPPHPRLAGNEHGRSNGPRTRFHRRRVVADSRTAPAVGTSDRRHAAQRHAAMDGAAGGTTGATRCPSQGLGLQVIAARAGRPRAWPSDNADGRPRSTPGSTSRPKTAAASPGRSPRPPSSGTGSAPPPPARGRRRMADAPSAPACRPLS